MPLKLPETIPCPLSPVCGKMTFHETGLWCQKDWRHADYFSKIAELFLLLKCLLLSCVQLFATPWIIVHQAPLSMGFPRQEYWSGLPFPSPGDTPDPGMELSSPALQANSLPSEPLGKPYFTTYMCINVLFFFENGYTIYPFGYLPTSLLKLF